MSASRGVLPVETSERGHRPRALIAAGLLGVCALTGYFIMRTREPGPLTLRVPDSLEAQQDTATPVGDFSISGPAGVLSVTLSVENGTLTLPRVDGLVVEDDGRTGNLTFSGDAAQVEAALDGLRYRGAAGYGGSDQLFVSVESDAEIIASTLTISVAVAQ